MRCYMTNHKNHPNQHDTPISMAHPNQIISMHLLHFKQPLVLTSNHIQNHSNGNYRIKWPQVVNLYIDSFIEFFTLQTDEFTFKWGISTT